MNKVKGVKKIRVDYSSSTVDVTYDRNMVTTSKLIEKITGEGCNVLFTTNYSINTTNNQRDKLTINQLVGIGVIIVNLYTIVSNTIGFNFISNIDQSMSYEILFIVGVLTSLPCIAMCGGISLSQCISHKRIRGVSRLEQLNLSTMYNTGRVISYPFIRGIVAILRVIMGLNMLNIFPSLRKLQPRMPRTFDDKIFNNEGKNRPFYIGLLNGLMPCRPLQTIQLYALGTGSFIVSTTSMFAFSLGTVPFMFVSGQLVQC